MEKLNITTESLPRFRPWASKELKRTCSWRLSRCTAAILTNFSHLERPARAHEEESIQRRTVIGILQESEAGENLSTHDQTCCAIALLEIEHKNFPWGSLESCYYRSQIQNGGQEHVAHQVSAVCFGTGGAGAAGIGYGHLRGRHLPAETHQLHNHHGRAGGYPIAECGQGLSRHVPGAGNHHACGNAGGSLRRQFGSGCHRCAAGRAYGLQRWSGRPSVRAGVGDPAPR
jgi:hypothetical protein